MNQTPAALLILTSSILAYAATVGGTTTLATTDAGLTTHTSAVGVILGLAGLMLGIWGIISLLGASIRDREMAFDGTARPDLLGMFDPRRIVRPYAPTGSPVATRTPSTPDSSGIQLSPEIKSQLWMVSHLEGRERSQIIEEALRRYLPRYEDKKAA